MKHYKIGYAVNDCLPTITEAVKRETMHHIKVFGSDNKA